MKKILLLGSGELGKELVISLKRLGAYVIAVDSYDNAPAQQVADAREVINMLNADSLDAIVAKHKPDLIIPEIEAIATEQFYKYEQQGYTVVPSAKAANFTMNRKAIRDLAAIDLKLKTAKYTYASSKEGLLTAAEIIGIPCVVKPLMSSSGKGQSVLKSINDVSKVWEYALQGSRGNSEEVIIEEFISFESEITLLTVTQKNGPTLFFPPIGHRQERGDYQESWIPHLISETHLAKAKNIAQQVTQALGGYGIFGVEFFITKDDVYFSELSPRPHDTGMVTLANCCTYNEFDAHARAVLHLPMEEIELHKIAVSSVILADRESSNFSFTHVEKVLQSKNTDIRIFGKPFTRPFRRMGVLLKSNNLSSNMTNLITETKELAKQVEIKYH